MRVAAIIRGSFTRWNDHDGQRLGAALAFYTLLSAAPLLLFLLLAVSILYGRDAGRHEIVEYVGTLMGGTAARLTQTFLSGAHRSAHGTIAGTFATATLLFGASGAFVELRDDLNRMWEAPPARSGILAIVIQRAFAFLLVLVAGSMMFGLMLISTLASSLSRLLSASIHVPGAVVAAGDLAVSLAVLTLIFVLIYRFVPDLVLSWSVLWIGASVTAALFVIAKLLLVWYLGTAGFASAYGAAGALMAVAFWAYCSAQIFLLCAEFTYLWSRRAGGAFLKAGRVLTIVPERRLEHDGLPQGFEVRGTDQAASERCTSRPPTWI